VRGNYWPTAEWKYDEQLFNDRIRGWTGYPHRCRMIDRMGAPPCDRIDRSAWPEAYREEFRATLQTKSVY
jgi:hypothetical protein